MKGIDNHFPISSGSDLTRLNPSLGDQLSCLSIAQSATRLQQIPEDPKNNLRLQALPLSEVEQTKKSAAMDSFWIWSRPTAGTSALPALLADLRNQTPGSDSTAAPARQLAPSRNRKLSSPAYTAVDLNECNLGVWVGVLAERGAEGFDVSEAGARWLAFPKAEYYLPHHGAYKIDSLMGAFFIYGSMDEAQATPALLKIASDASHPAREQALAILLFQATPESFRAIKIANKSDAQTGTVCDAPPSRNPRRVKPRG